VILIGRLDGKPVHTGVCGALIQQADWGGRPPVQKSWKSCRGAVWIEENWRLRLARVPATVRPTAGALDMGR